MDLRYGVNPHQSARIDASGPQPLRLLHGSPSYINLLDALNAWQLVHQAAGALGGPAAASFKHVSPAGVAVAGEPDATMREVWDLSGPIGALTSAYVRARDADPKCSFGDLIAVSHPVDRELAEFLARVISDGIVAPGFDEGTLEILGRKKRGSFLVFEADPGYQPPAWERREVFGMVLEQEQDLLPVTPESLKVVAGPALPPEAVNDAILGMITLRYTQSNSVVYLKDGMTLGIGAGQQSRVDCTRLAGAKAANWWLRRNPAVRELALSDGLSRQDRLNWQVRFAEGDITPGESAVLQKAAEGALPDLSAGARAEWVGKLEGLTLASDGFIPFRDNIDYAGRYGVRYVVEPGGSMRSEDVAAACDELGMTLVHTGIRLFHH
ncbi:MAG TPA: phosphoribosylaminoimidazolecarboxamide formyltransferase [Actinomycetota bacterium]|nr:phosphoribosylaminoimidazolecarboxamide formyltransferase [Actinomycetota bacterium]